MNARGAVLGLCALTVLGLVVRGIGLDGPLWLDEIVTVVEYASLAPAQARTAFAGPNNHLLNTVLIRACIECFGAQEWAIRLPAMLAGVAGVPALYWAARAGLSVRASMLAAALLLLAPHHVFFSQSARGYTGHLLASTLAAGALARALTGERVGPWLGFVAASLLNFASLLLAAAPFAVHALVALAAGLRQGRTQAQRAGLAVAAVAAGAGWLYAPVVIGAVRTLEHEYRAPGVGYRLGSLDIVREVVRGLSEGVGPALLLAALPAVLVAAGGARRLAQRSPELAASLLLPPLAIGAATLVLGASTTPRHFLLALPAVTSALAAGSEALAERIEARTGWSAGRLLVLAALGAAVVSAPLTARFVTVPKQDMPGALGFIADHEATDATVAAIFIASKPARYYADQLAPGQTLVDARSTDALDAARAASERPVIAVSTFHRALAAAEPTLDQALRRDFEEIAHFPGTVGDGAVTVWRERVTPSEAVPPR